MNDLTNDFNEFVSRRLDHVEAISPTPQVNEAAECLKETLNQSQLQILIDALDFERNTGSIFEEYAYRQGFVDALRVMAM